MPEGANPDGDTLADLRTGVAAAKGHPILHETVVRGHGDPGGAPHGDLRPVRFGAAWPSAVADLRDPIGQSVMLACGIPTALTSNSDGTSAREGLRRLLATTIKPVAKILETELRAKLDPAAALTFGELAASRYQRQGASRRAARQSGPEHRRREGGGGSMSLRPNIRRAVKIARRSVRSIEVNVTHEHGISRSSSGRITYAHSDTRRAIVEPVTQLLHGRGRIGASVQSGRDVSVSRGDRHCRPDHIAEWCSPVRSCESLKGVADPSNAAGGGFITRLLLG